MHSLDGSYIITQLSDVIVRRYCRWDKYNVSSVQFSWGLHVYKESWKISSMVKPLAHVIQQQKKKTSMSFGQKQKKLFRETLFGQNKHICFSKQTFAKIQISGFVMFGEAVSSIFLQCTKISCFAFCTSCFVGFWVKKKILHFS